MPNRSEIVRLRVTPDLKAAIQAAAQAENRSLTNYIENLILRSLKEQEQTKK